MIDTQALKARVDLRSLVQETHPVTKGSKIQCLWHDDRNPSLHVYPDGYFCFACGASGDHLDWLTATRALSFQEAVEVLVHHAGTVADLPTQAVALPTPKTNMSHEPLEKPPCEWHLPLKQHQLETHQRRAANLSNVPEALSGRGFTLADCKHLNIVNENGNAVFPVVCPLGLVLTLKCRYTVPTPHRYEYITPGRGTPAWCSPGIAQAKTILIIEGELNGMICWLACREKHLGVMGTAGANGWLHLDVLKDKTIYIYADDDDAGLEARQRWAKQALGTGAKEVYLLEPWSADACDLAGAFGKAGLRQRLAWSEKRRYTPVEALDAINLTGALYPAANLYRPSANKPDLMQWCSSFRASLTLGSATPLSTSSAIHAGSCHDAA